jgi:hypothetical protein
MRTSEQSPNGVKGIEHVVGRERAGHTQREQAMHRRHSARHVMVAIAPHQEQVG